MKETGIYKYVGPTLRTPVKGGKATNLKGKEIYIEFFNDNSLILSFYYRSLYYSISFSPYKMRVDDLCNYQRIIRNIKKVQPPKFNKTHYVLNTNSFLYKRAYAERFSGMEANLFYKSLLYLKGKKMSISAWDRYYDPSYPNQTLMTLMGFDARLFKDCIKTRKEKLQKIKIEIELSNTWKAGNTGKPFIHTITA